MGVDNKMDSVGPEGVIHHKNNGKGGFGNEVLKGERTEPEGYSPPRVLVNGVW